MAFDAVDRQTSEATIVSPQGKGTKKVSLSAPSGMTPAVTGDNEELSISKTLDLAAPVH